MNLLLERDVDANTYAAHVTALILQFLSLYGHKNVFMVLLACDADVNIKGGKFGTA